MTVRWGVLGSALITRRWVIPAIQSAAGCELRAIASRDSARAQAVAAEFGIEGAYGSYEELLAAPDIEAVYIPLPNHLHAEWVKHAADAGKHILCEKPLTLDAAEAQDVVEHCARRGVLLMEAFMYRFHPAWIHAMELIAAGRIGRVTDVNVWFAFRSDRPDDYRHTPEFGGGALLDVGCYAVNTCRALLGDRPPAVRGAARVDPHSGVDMTYSAILDYGDATGTFTVSMELEPDHRLHIYGTAGWLTIEHPYNCLPDVVNRITIASGGDHHPAASTLEIIEVAPADQYALQATAFAASVRSGGPAPWPPQDSVANMALVDELFGVAGITR